MTLAFVIWIHFGFGGARGRCALPVFLYEIFFPPGAHTPKHWMPWGEEMWDHYTANFNSSGEIKCLFRLLAASDVFPWLLNPPATTDWKRVEGKHPLELSYLKTR